MELDLQSLFGLLCTAVLIGRAPSTTLPLPHIWAHIRGRNWSAKIDDISGFDPIILFPAISGEFGLSICVLKYAYGLMPFIYLYEPDDVGEHEECADVVHPLEEPEQDEGSPVDDEPGREDGSHAPYRQVLTNQGS